MNKIVHSCSLPRISFFKRCMKEDVVAAAIFMFVLTLFPVFLTQITSCQQKNADTKVA